MARVAFLAHSGLDEAEHIAQRGDNWLSAHGHEALMITKPPEVYLHLDSIDLLVSLGGDGTMLRAMEMAYALQVPVMGVNLGRLGYLTEVDPSSLETALERFLGGHYDIEERMVLEVDIDDKHHIAMNEAVLEKVQPGHTILVSAYIAEKHFLTYAADGIVISTATGSTAYNLSLRGPILSPRLRAMVMTPISPHMLFDRPLVLEPDEDVVLRIEGTRPATFLIDGKEMSIVEPGGELRCRGSSQPVRVVKMDGADLRSVLKDKFGLMDR